MLEKRPLNGCSSSSSSSSNSIFSLVDLLDILEKTLILLSKECQCTEGQRF